MILLPPFAIILIYCIITSLMLREIKIGNIRFDQPIIALAPMENVTDLPFRLFCHRMGADIVYTEFTSSEAIKHEIPRALQKIEISEEERPVGIQIFGGVEESMELAAQKVEQFQPDLIDVNCGCWVKNHVARGEGAALLKDLPRFEKIVKSTVNATKLPVTVKTRLGWDEGSIVICDVAKMVEQAGAKALTVHCRTRSQAHEGAADWHWLEKIKKVVSIPIIGNGDVRNPQDAKRMLDTGCDGVMVGRAAIGNPWIFNHTKHFLKCGDLLPPPSLQERIELCVEHLKLCVDYGGIRGGLIPFRKYYAGYFKGIPNIAQLRSDLMQFVEVDKIVERLYQFLDQAQPAAINVTEC